MSNNLSNYYRIGLAVLIIGIFTAAASAVEISYLFENNEEYTDVHFDYRVPVTFIAAGIEHEVPNAESYVTNMNTFRIVTSDKEVEIYIEHINASNVFGFKQFIFIEIESGFELSLRADGAKWERDFRANITFYGSSGEVLRIQNWNINDDTYNLTSNSGGHLAVYCDCFYEVNIIHIYANSLSWIVTPVYASWLLMLLPAVIILRRRKHG